MKKICTFAVLVVLAALAAAQGHARDLRGILEAGVLRHLGVPYAGFVTSPGQGLDAEVMMAFAKHLGVGYEYIATDWGTAIPDLLGCEVRVDGASAVLGAQVPVRGDVLASGLTVLPWREQVLAFSASTFPTQVWLVVRADSPIQPIVPTGDVDTDIELTREKLSGLQVLCKSGTCLDPRFFDLEKAGAGGVPFPGSLNDLAPAVILGDADATLLDVPDAVMALQKFPGKIKIVGPMSREQRMAVAFSKDQPELLAEFNRFFAEFSRSGRYLQLVNDHYPLIHRYYPDFFLP